MLYFYRIGNYVLQSDQKAKELVKGGTEQFAIEHLVFADNAMVQVIKDGDKFFNAKVRWEEKQL